MSPAPKAIYVPALRMKSGELQGLQQLAEDVKSYTLPHVIVPPPAERDDELQRALIDVESVPGAGVVLSRYWAGRRAILDLRYLFNDFGEASCGIWLPKAFELARRERVLAVPVASLADLAGARMQSFKDAIAGSDGLKFALRIPSGDLVGAAIADELRRALERLGIVPADAAVIADFTDADFSQPELVAGVIEGAMQLLEEVAPWQAIVFQGTSYPEVNPAARGGDILVPRNEWKAWSTAVRFSGGTAQHLLFGDYAADCARMLFGKSGAPAIRHYRYTTPTDWFVVRAAETGRDSTLMRDVCQRILGSGYFAGQTFSSADNYIYRTAQGVAGPGTATTWREVNTTHHITRVVRDMGRVKDLSFTDLRVEPIKQYQMFE